MATDLDHLQGAWTIATLEVNGASLPATGGITITGASFTTTSMGAEYTGRVELDPPNKITLFFETGPENGRTNRGIYECIPTGWRLCLSLTGGPAPTDFATAPGSNHALETLVRPASIPTPKPAGPPIAELQGEWSMVSCIRSGDPLPKTMAKSAVRRVNGITTTLHFGPQLFMEGIVSHHPAAPNAMQLTSKSGQSQLGIYTRTGDELQTCIAAPGRPLPPAFTTTPQGGETLTTWKPRAAAKAK